MNHLLRVRCDMIWQRCDIYLWISTQVCHYNIRVFNELNSWNISVSYDCQFCMTTLTTNKPIVLHMKFVYVCHVCIHYFHKNAIHLIIMCMFSERKCADIFTAFRTALLRQTNLHNWQFHHKCLVCLLLQVRCKAGVHLKKEIKTLNKTGKLWNSLKTRFKWISF